MFSYLRLAIGLGVMLALVGAFFYGRGAGIDHQQAKNAKAVAAATAKVEEQRKVIDALAMRVATAQRDQSTETRTIYEKATQYIDRPVYRNQCVDADGVGLLDRAIANANRGLTGVLDGGAAFTPPVPTQP